jgi:hypothetical protein
MCTETYGMGMGMNTITLDIKSTMLDIQVPDQG